jgi:hypothetical protein
MMKDLETQYKIWVNSQDIYDPLKAFKTGFEAFKAGFEAFKAGFELAKKHKTEIIISYNDDPTITTEIKWSATITKNGNSVHAKSEDEAILGLIDHFPDQLGIEVLFEDKDEN